MAELKKIRVEGIGSIPAFCHATVHNDQVFVSGMLGTREGAMELVTGGVRAETEQIIRNFRTILSACGLTLNNVAKVNVYLTDIKTFDQMNAAYIAAFGDNPPARLTIGCSGLALNAQVEMDCIAFLP